MIALVKTKVSVPRSMARSFQSDRQFGVIALEFGSLPANGEFTITNPGSQSTDSPGIGMHNHGIRSGICFLVGDT